jgi:hypothetical protein
MRGKRGSTPRLLLKFQPDRGAWRNPLMADTLFTHLVWIWQQIDFHKRLSSKLANSLRKKMIILHLMLNNTKTTNTMHLLYVSTFAETHYFLCHVRV